MKILFSLLNQEIILSPTTPTPGSFMTSLPLLDSCSRINTTHQHREAFVASLNALTVQSFKHFAKFTQKEKKSETLASAVIPKGEHDSCFNIWEVMSLVSSAKEP